MSSPDLHALFAAEAVGLLDRLGADALALEADPDPARVAAMFRAAHTLKGSAAMVGLPEVRDVAHALEDLLDAVRGGLVAIAPPVVDAVLATVDAVRAVLPSIAAGEDPGPVGQEATARLVEVLLGQTPEPPAWKAAVEEGHAAAAAERAEQQDAPVEAPAAPLPPAEAPAASPPSAGGGPAAAPLPPAAAPSAPTPAPASGAIAVPLSRLDRLVRLAGAARTAELRLRGLLPDGLLEEPDVEAAVADLERTLERLQGEALGVRMVTVGELAEPLRRAARDVARAEGKQADLVLDGEQVELDRGVLDVLREPLLHLVRNAVGHGLEPPEERRAAGKPPGGTVRVHARRRGPDLEVRVADDGRGLDPDAVRAAVPGGAGLSDQEALARVFEPGVSTAAEVTEVQGRGVGLDAVRVAAERIRGSVAVDSAPGAGATFTLTVPVTLAVVRSLVVRVGAERYALPAHAVVAAEDAGAGAQVGLEGGAAVWLGGDLVPLADLGPAVGAAPSAPDGPAVVLAAGPRRLGLRVDELLGQRDLTVQELGGVVPPSDLVAGASIDADGGVLLVLDPGALTARAGRAPVPAGAAAAPVPAARAQGTVLVVDDALTVRELQRSILERAGYAVLLAEDGEQGLELALEHRPDVVLTDVEMPGMDGIALVEALRAHQELAGMPILIVSSRSDDADRRRGLEAGADGYVAKQEFDEASLLAAVRRTLGDPAP